jgi:transposase
MRRHELTDEEWAVIAPLLPTNSRGVERVDDRRATTLLADKAYDTDSIRNFAKQRQPPPRRQSHRHALQPALVLGRSGVHLLESRGHSSRLRPRDYRLGAGRQCRHLRLGCARHDAGGGRKAVWRNAGSQAIEHLSDNGSAYKARDMRPLAQALNLTACFAPGYRPAVERHVGGIRRNRKTGSHPHISSARRRNDALAHRRLDRGRQRNPSSFRAQHGSPLRVHQG